jgi:D-sedoheptulose 7-phosphate isomerase
MNPHVQNLRQQCPELSVCQNDVIQAFEMMRDCFRHGGKILLCGNGGSAADADHWAAELLKSFVLKCPLSQKDQHGLPVELELKL